MGDRISRIVGAATLGSGVAGAATFGVAGAATFGAAGTATFGVAGAATLGSGVTGDVGGGPGISDGDAGVNGVSGSLSVMGTETLVLKERLQNRRIMGYYVIYALCSYQFSCKN